MGNNDDIKDDLKSFWRKALPWAIVFVCAYVLGFVTGVLV